MENIEVLLEKRQELLVKVRHYEEQICGLLLQDKLAKHLPEARYGESILLHKPTGKRYLLLSIGGMVANNINARRFNLPNFYGRFIKKNGELSAMETMLYVSDGLELEDK